MRRWCLPCIPDECMCLHEVGAVVKGFPWATDCDSGQRDGCGLTTLLESESLDLPTAL
jgi:hypothetical protein